MYYKHGIQAYFCPTPTVTSLSAQSHSCQQLNANRLKGISLESVACGFSTLSLGYCPSTLLQSEHSVEIISQMVENSNERPVKI